jgi:glutathione S-transferase
MKLIYFDCRGRVDPARLMLELAGAPYTYEAIPMAAWKGPEGKARVLERTPFGQLPLLEDGSLTLCQSVAILHHLARKLGLYGDTLEQMARVDEVYETYRDVSIDITSLNWHPKFHEVRADNREITKKKLASLARYFERTRADAEHWVLPGRYTLADVAMAFLFETILPMHPGIVEEHPSLHHMMTAFFHAPGVREYVRSPRRPKTWTVRGAMFAGTPEETHQWTDA